MIGHLNYTHIAVSTVAYFAIGSIWYSVLFSKKWMSLGRITMGEADKKNIFIMFGITLILNFIITVSTACVVHLISPPTLVNAIKVGLMLGGGIVFATCAMSYMYAKRPFLLTWIDAGYHFAGITVVSVILMLWK